MEKEIFKIHDKKYYVFLKRAFLSKHLEKGVIVDYLKSDLNMTKFSLSIGKSKHYAPILSRRLRVCNAQASLMFGKGNDEKYRHYYNFKLKVPRTRKEKDRMLKLIESYTEKQNYLYEFVFIDEKNHPKLN